MEYLALEEEESTIVFRSRLKLMTLKLNVEMENKLRL